MVHRGVVDPKLKPKLKWLHNPCLLRVSNVGRNNLGRLTSIAPEG